jgi:hypothetical protein
MAQRIDPRYFGQIVVAEIIDQTEDSYYKATARILTGTPEGKIAHVGYLGDIEQLVGREALLRISPFEPGRSILERVEIPTSLLTTNIPPGFCSCDSNNALFYYQWDSIDSGIKVPIYTEIYSKRSPGFTPLSLYLGSFYNFLVSFYIEDIYEPEVLTEKDEKHILNRGILHVGEFMKDPEKYIQHHRERTLLLKGPEKSMYRYFVRMSNKNPKNQFPRLVGIEQEVNFDRIVRPFFQQTLDEAYFGIKWIIRLEEQV